MQSRIAIGLYGSLAILVLVAGVSLVAAPGGAAQETHTTTKFSGAKVNAGTVTHAVEGRKHTLTLSDEFKTPDTPDPHWQIVDSSGTAYILSRCMIKGDKLNKKIEVPAYVRDVAKVQIWCAWAETVLGEASFARPIAIAAPATASKTASR